MTSGIDKLSAARALDLVREGLLRKGAPEQLARAAARGRRRAPGRHLIEGGAPVAAWPVSTARNGDRRRGRLVPHAARLASRSAGDRRGRRARRGVRLAPEDRRAMVRRGRATTISSSPASSRSTGSRTASIAGPAATSLDATSICTARTTRTCSADRHHGCVRLSNRDVVRAVRALREGDLV